MRTGIETSSTCFGCFNRLMIDISELKCVIKSLYRIFKNVRMVLLQNEANLPVEIRLLEKLKPIVQAEQRRRGVLRHALQIHMAPKTETHHPCFHQQGNDDRCNLVNRPTCGYGVTHRLGAIPVPYGGIISSFFRHLLSCSHTRR